jgi:hypothetical protein
VDPSDTTQARADRLAQEIAPTLLDAVRGVLPDKGASAAAQVASKM